MYISENPIFLKYKNLSLGIFFKLIFLISISCWIIKFICSKNHMSIFDISKIFFIEYFLLKASAKYHILFGPASLISVSSFPLGDFSIPSQGSRPFTSYSNPEIAFRRASVKHLPIAITSPTDFIWVVSLSLVFGNFSKANLGILTTV